VELAADGSFVFPNVAPGQYRVKVNADNRCFGSDEVKVALKAADIADLKFSQVRLFPLFLLVVECREGPHRL